MKMPNDQVYDDEDYENYADILVKTNALKIGNASESRTPKANESWKWNNLLKRIIYYGAKEIRLKEGVLS